MIEKQFGAEYGPPLQRGDKTACIVSLQAEIDRHGGVPYGWVRIYEVLLFAFYNPLLASAVLTFLLAVALIASGLLRIWVGFNHRPQDGWGWIVAAGVISALAGLVIAMHWPVNSVWVLGLFLAVDLIFQGWSFVALGLALKK